MAETFVQTLTRLLEEKTREAEGLTVKLAEAPHAYRCEIGVFYSGCTCWKAELEEDALVRVESRVLLRAANEIEDRNAAEWLKNRAERP